jgi:competence ComEA-like helix-hairpin-helix protein
MTPTPAPSTFVRGPAARFMAFAWLLPILLLLSPLRPATAETVDINRADAATLQQHLKNIGPTRSKAIVDYRNKHGKFGSIDDLTKVPGIGPGILEQNRGRLSPTKGVYRTEQGSKSQADSGSKGSAKTSTAAKKSSSSASKKQASADKQKKNTK